MQEVDDYIDTFPLEIRKLLDTLRQTILAEVPDAVEVISYKMPTYKLNGKNLVHFAAWENHIGLYPTPSALKEFEKDLEGYTKSKGSIHFPLGKPLPKELIKKIVEFRVKEVSG